jgi:gluconokinase
MEIDPASARARIEQRGTHFFAPSLVASQFDALESPVGEPGVLRVDALAPLPQLQAQVSAWLRDR